jgi:hypothetical protein
LHRDVADLARRLVLARGRRSRLGFGRDLGVCDMTMTAERKSVWIKTRAASYEGPLRNHTVAPTPAPKPAPAPTPAPALTDAETDRIEREIREALVRYRSQANIQSRIKSELAEHDELWDDVIGKLVSDLRKQWRREIQEELGQFRADATVQRAAERRNHDRGEVVEMLAPLEKRRA